MKSFYKVKNYHVSFFKCEQRDILLVIVIIIQTNYCFKTSLSFTFGATLQWGDTTYRVIQLIKSIIGKAIDKIS